MPESPHPYARRLGCDGFYATAPGAPERAGEEQRAAARGLVLRELKPLEGAALAILDTEDVAAAAARARHWSNRA